MAPTSASELAFDPDGEVDISLIECNLALSPQERIEAHQAALDLVQALQAAKKVVNAKPQSTARTPDRS